MKVETEIKEEVNRVAKIERVEIIINGEKSKIKDFPINLKKNENFIKNINPTDFIYNLSFL